MKRGYMWNFGQWVMFYIIGWHLYYQIPEYKLGNKQYYSWGKTSPEMLSTLGNDFYFVA